MWKEKRGLCDWLKGKDRGREGHPQQTSRIKRTPRQKGDAISGLEWARKTKAPAARPVERKYKKGTRGERHETEHSGLLDTTNSKKGGKEKKNGTPKGQGRKTVGRNIEEKKGGYPLNRKEEDLKGDKCESEKSPYWRAMAGCFFWRVLVVGYGGRTRDGKGYEEGSGQHLKK